MRTPHQPETLQSPQSPSGLPRTLASTRRRSRLILCLAAVIAVGAVGLPLAPPSVMAAADDTEGDSYFMILLTLEA
jgi:hypothetical protein